MEAQPLVVASSEATLELSLRAETDAERLNVTIQVEDGDGQPLSTTTRTLVADRPSVIAGSIDLRIPPDTEAGIHRISLEDARDESDANATELEITGSSSTIFFVEDDGPVAGGIGPVWPQLGADARHSGRSLNLGPQQVDLVRWRASSEDGRPFHDPIIDADDEITAVTWGGVVHRFTSDGAPIWDPPLRLGSSVPFPPALSSGGAALIATGDGELRAISPDGREAWTTQVTASGDLVSGPVVADDGTIYVVADEWTLAAISPEGVIETTRDLDTPSAYDPPRSSIPAPLPGPPVAVDEEGTVVTIVQGAIAELARDNLSVEAQIPCNCTPRGVSLVPSSSIALVMGDEEVVAVDRSTATIAWRTGDTGRPGAALDGQIYAPPVVGWGSQGSQPVFITDAGGSVHVITVGGAHIKSWGNVFGPIYGQAAIDADGDLYLGDACRELRSLTGQPSRDRNHLDPRWTKTLATQSCSDVPSGVTIADGGGVLWAGPDGELRMLGKDRPPKARFSVDWDQQRGWVFDARASEDPDGSPLTYTWRFDEGPVKRGSTIAHTFTTSGNHTVHLTVDDGSSTVTASRTMDINLPPAPRIDQRILEGGDIQLDANDTSDPDDEEITFWWHVEGQGGVQGPTLTLPGTQPRVYEVALHVSDGDHNATLERTVLAPRPAAWTNETLATYSGDCEASICTVPSSLTFTKGGLVEIAIANGVGRTMTVEPGLPVVPGGPETVVLQPREQESLYLQVEDGRAEALTLSIVGISREASVPLEVRPAPADVTWRLTETDGLEAGASSSLILELEGPPPPGDVSLSFSLRSGAQALAVEEVNLREGESPNRTVRLSFVPEEVGPFTARIVADTADEAYATIAPTPGEQTVRTFHVSEPSIVTMATRVATDNPYAVGGVALLAIVSLATTGIWWVRKDAEEAEAEVPVEPSPGASTATSPASQADDATVAQGFMPRKVDRFRIDQVLGEGGFGTTYLAHDGVLERDVVLKDLENVGEGDARDLLLHEAKTAANLQHNNVVVVHDVIEQEGRLLLVMEYVEGGTLADRVDEPMALKQALPLAHDVLDGLAALHEAGIVHRDLKPSNILIAPDGSAKITDFGVAVSLEEAPEGEAFVGTPRYMAPEQLVGDPPGPQADVYAAGALVYRMLTGEHHLGLDDDLTPPADEIVEREVRLPIPSVPQAVNDVLARALARDPSQRFPDGAAFARALDELTTDDSRAPEGLTEK